MKYLIKACKVWIAISTLAGVLISTDPLVLALGLPYTSSILERNSSPENFLYPTNSATILIVPQLKLSLLSKFSQPLDVKFSYNCIRK